MRKNTVQGGSSPSPTGSPFSTQRDCKKKFIKIEKKSIANDTTRKNKQTLQQTFLKEKEISKRTNKKLAKPMPKFL